MLWDGYIGNKGNIGDGYISNKGNIGDGYISNKGNIGDGYIGNIGNIGDGYIGNRGNIGNIEISYTITLKSDDLARVSIEMIFCYLGFYPLTNLYNNPSIFNKCR